MARKTKAVVEKELKQALSDGQRLQGDLDFARRALDAEKKKNHDCQLQLGESNRLVAEKNKQIRRLEAEYAAFKKGALDTITGE